MVGEEAAADKRAPPFPALSRRAAGVACRPVGGLGIRHPSRAGRTRRAGVAAQDEALLARLPLFAGVAPDALRTLLEGASVRRRPRRAVLFLQGEPAEHFYVVLDGWVKLFRTAPDGQETVIAVFGRGESFAEAASFAEGVFPVGAQAAEDARLLAVPVASFTRQIARDPALAVNMLAGMSRHLHGLVREIERRAVKSAAQRLGAFLLEWCPEGGAAAIDLPTDKGLVAARLGMRPETLSRALAKLRAVGVSTRDHRVAVADVDALRRYAEGGRADAA